MHIVRDILLAGDTYKVRSYQPGELVIHQQSYLRSLILTPQNIIDDWEPQEIDELQSGHLGMLTTLDPVPEVILVGTGRRQHFPPRDVIRPLIDARIGFEIMDTGAACRTYNILLGEDRKVAAALLIR